MLTPHRVRLADVDREEYGGPEWIEIDPARFVDIRVSVLRDWKEQTGFDVLDVLGRDFDYRRDIIAVTAVVWMARQMAGCTEKYVDFDPHLLAAVVEALPTKPEDGDADPPSPSSTGSPVEKPRRSRHGSGR